MKQIPTSLLTLTAGILIALISFWVGQHHGLLPVQASEQAPLVDQFFSVMVTIATGLFIVVEGAILLFAIQFRRRPGDHTDGEPIEGNLPLEAFWTAIPAIIILGLSIYSVNIYQQMGGLALGGHGAMAHAPATTLVAQSSSPTSRAGTLNRIRTTAEPPATDSDLKTRYGIGAASDDQPDLTVDVTGFQYAWLFNYPDSGILAGELHVPMGADVQLNLTAKDVIHALWVPQFRLKQDVFPGQQTQLRFVATKVGTYPIICAELCGSYHGNMRTRVVVHRPEEYDQWVKDNLPVSAQAQAPTVALNSTDL